MAVFNQSQLLNMQFRMRIILKRTAKKYPVMRTKMIFAGLAVFFMGATMAEAQNATQASPAPAITGIATFNTNGVNLRKEPNAYSPYLCYMQGDELYYDPENVMWSSDLGSTRINGQIVITDHEKIQGGEGIALGVLGSEGDWVKLSYAPYEVWTMKKFLNVKPLTSPTTSTTAGYNSYNQFNLTGDSDGSLAIFYQEAGMDEDEGLMIGKKQGDTVVFDLFLPVYMKYDEKVKNVEVSKDPQFGNLIITYGPAQKLASFADYPVIDVKGFSAENINSLLPLATQQPTRIFVTTGSEFLFL